jgi:hypothetical protein
MKMTISGRNDIRPPAGAASCACALEMKKSKSSMRILVIKPLIFYAADMGANESLFNQKPTLPLAQPGIINQRPPSSYEFALFL